MVLQDVLMYILIPPIAVIVGGTIAAYRIPGQQLRSIIQHFAAGIVFAAVSVELLPDVKHERAALPVLIGFSLGVLVMLIIRKVSGKIEKEAGGKPKPSGLMVVVGIDILIDGLLIGIGFSVGAQQGLLLTFALTMEILFLGLSVAAALGRAGVNRRNVIFASAGLAVLFLLGAVSGITIFSTLTGSVFTAVLAFGLAALLYLVTEELLIEAHEVPDTLLSTTIFFVGFLTLLIISIITEV